VLQRHAGLAWLPMASEEGVGKNMRYAALAVKRLVDAVFVLPATLRSPMRRERASRVGGSAATGKRPESDRRERPLTQERPEHYIASPSSRKNSSGQTQARAAAPERARPRRLPGHGKPSTAPRLPQHRARQATDARQPAGAHTTAAATRPSSGPPGRGQARPASATRARAQRWPIPSVSLRCAIYCITEIDYIIV
jgi:hypothetical protein